MLKDLLEQFAILEGDVVSFADFKAKKDGEEIKEEPKTDGKKHVEIVEVTFKWKEGDQKSNDILEIGKTYPYEEAQKRVYELDYYTWNSASTMLYGGCDKSDYTAKILVDGQEDTYEGHMEFGQGYTNPETLSFKYNMQYFLGDEYIVDSPDIPYDMEEFKKKYGTREENVKKYIEDNKPELPVSTDYSAKSIDEVAIGDIFFNSEYSDYSRKTYYDFFRVVKRSKSSVWVEKLKVKKIKELVYDGKYLDDQYYEVPSDETAEEQKMLHADLTKPFRLSLGYDNRLQCSQGSGHYKEILYAWKGKAMKESFEQKSIYAKLNEDLKPYLHEFYNVEGLDSIDMTIVSLGMEDGIETLELDGVQFCRAEDEELSNAIDICIEEEFMPEWKEQGIVSYNVDSVLFDKEDGNGVAYVGLFRGDDLDESADKAEELKKIFEDAFKGGKMNCFETAKGVVYVEPQGEQLVYGGMTNGGIIPEYKFDYDFNHSFDWNLQGHIEQIMEEEGYPIDESLNEDISSLDDIVFLEEDPLYDGECYPKKLPNDEENKYYVAMGYKDYRNSEDGKLVKATPDYEKSTGLVKIPYSEFEDGFGMAYQDSFDEAPDEETIDMYCLGYAVYFKEVVDEKELLLNFTVLADVEDHHLEYDVTGKWIPPKSLNESLNEDESVEEKLQKIADEVKAEINKIYADDKDLLEYFVVEPLIKEGHYNDGSTLYGIEVRTELSYEDLWNLSDKLDELIKKYDKDAYFDMEGGGIITAVFDFDKKEPLFRVVIEDGKTPSILKCYTLEEAEDIFQQITHSPNKDKILRISIEKLEDGEYKVIKEEKPHYNESINEGLYGLPDVEYISHGDWSDGEVEYQGFLYNAADVTEFVYDDYAEYCKENNEQESDEGFDKWIKDNTDYVYSALSVLNPHEAYAIFKNKELVAIYGNADTAFTKAFEMGAEEQEDGFLSGEFDVAEMKDYKWVRSNRYVDMPDGGVIRDVEESDWAKVQVNESLAEAVEKYPKQLAQAIKKCWYGDYKDKGRYAKIGKWEIGLGGYDTGYEVSFDGTPIFAIRTTWGDNKVDMYQDEDDIKNLCGYNFKQIMKAINEVDPETILNEPEQMYRLVIKTDEDNLSVVNEILGHYSEIEADDIDDNSYDSIICFYVNKNDKDILNQIYKDLKELNNDAIELKEPFEIY